MAVRGAANGSQAAADGPAAALGQFLEAVRTGKDQQTNHMLTAKARTTLAQLGGGGLTPPASDTARFTVGKVDLIGQDGARVASTWTCLDKDGKPVSRQMLWVMRHEAEGWRVAGVAWTIIEDQPPLLLNFEDKEELLRKAQWLQGGDDGGSGTEKNPEKAETPPAGNIRR
jgi:hypothetical protein